MAVRPRVPVKQDDEVSPDFYEKTRFNQMDKHSDDFPTAIIPLQSTCKDCPVLDERDDARTAYRRLREFMNNCPEDKKLVEVLEAEVASLGRAIDDLSARLHAAENSVCEEVTPYLKREALWQEFNSILMSGAIIIGDFGSPPQSYADVTRTTARFHEIRKLLELK